MNLSNNNLKSFLLLGYFLDYRNTKYAIDFSNIDKNKYISYSDDELIDIGINIFRKAIARRFKENEIHVVPISGGLDSRAILTGLLEFTEARNIYTYTFGTPKTLDYEIGNQVAKKIGTNHTIFPLTDYKYTLEELIDISDRIDRQTVLFHHPPVQEIYKKFKGSSIWSGYLGDPLTGSHFPNSKAQTLSEAKKKFIEKNQYVRSVNMMYGHIDDLYQLIDSNLISKDLLSIEEQLDFQNRQTKFIAPHVLMNGFTYRTPFLDPDWVRFCLSVEDSYRKDQFLYKKILSKLNPMIFSIATKTNFGLPINANKIKVYSKRVTNKLQKFVAKKFSFYVNPYINYLDFDEAIRDRDDINSIIHECITDLIKRKIVDWINVEKIYKKHMDKKGDFADALIVLASLEIHIKSYELAQKNWGGNLDGKPIQSSSHRNN